MRQFLSQSYPDRKGLIFITGKDFRYMRQVLRTKPGDMVSIRLPDGTLQNTTVAQISEETRTLTLQVCSSKCSLTEKPESSEKHCVSAAQISANLNATEYWLFQFIAKPAKMEQIIRQAVECGVSCIVPNGAFYVMMNIEKLVGKTLGGKLIENDDDFAVALLEKALVAVVPCSGFGMKNFVRWSYAASMENIEKGLDRLEKFVTE